jgi:hypothetical protein
MPTLYKKKGKWGVWGRSYMFSDHVGSRQYKESLAGKWFNNRKRQAYVYWKDMGQYYMKDHHIFD